MIRTVTWWGKSVHHANCASISRSMHQTRFGVRHWLSPIRTAVHFAADKVSLCTTNQQRVITIACAMQNMSVIPRPQCVCVCVRRWTPHTQFCYSRIFSNLLLCFTWTTAYCWLTLMLSRTIRRLCCQPTLCCAVWTFAICRCLIHRSSPSKWISFSFSHTRTAVATGHCLPRLITPIDLALERNNISNIE